MQYSNMWNNIISFLCNQRNEILKAKNSVYLFFMSNILFGTKITVNKIPKKMIPIHTNIQCVTMYILLLYL